MKPIIYILVIVLFTSCDAPTKFDLNHQLLEHDMVVTDSLLLHRLSKLENQVKKFTNATDSIAWEFEHYRYWLWKEHNLTEHDYSNYDYSYSFCIPPTINPEMQKRTKLPSKNKNSLY